MEACPEPIHVSNDPNTASQPSNSSLPPALPASLALAPVVTFAVFPLPFALGAAVLGPFGGRSLYAIGNPCTRGREGRLRRTDVLEVGAPTIGRRLSLTPLDLQLLQF